MPLYRAWVLGSVINRQCPDISYRLIDQVRGSTILQEISYDLHVRGSLLQERCVGGILEFMVLSIRNAVEEGLDDPILRNVSRPSVDHQGRDFNLRESVNYGPRCERTGPTRSQISANVREYENSSMIAYHI